MKFVAVDGHQAAAQTSGPTFTLDIPFDGQDAYRMQDYAEALGHPTIADLYQSALVSALVRQNPQAFDVLSQCEAELDNHSIKLIFSGAASEFIHQASIKQDLAQVARKACATLIETCFGDPEKIIVPTPRVSFGGAPIIH